MANKYKFYDVDIQKLRSQGFNTTEIAKILDLGKQSVVDYCQRNKDRLPKGSAGKEVYRYRYDIDKIEELLAENKYCREIARETKIAESTLYKIFKLFGLSITEEARERSHIVCKEGQKQKKGIEKPGKTCSLCYFCKNTNLHDCSWFNPDNPQPRDDWEAESVVFIGHSEQCRNGFIVRKCGGFVAEKKEYEQWAK